MSFVAMHGMAYFQRPSIAFILGAKKCMLKELDSCEVMFPNNDDKESDNTNWLMKKTEKNIFYSRVNQHPIL